MVARAIAAVSAGIGAKQASKARKASAAQAASQNKAAAVQEKRQRRAAIRSNILASARSRASAQAAGSLSSSGFLGGMGAGQSQLASESGFGTQLSGLNVQAAAFGQQARKYSDQSQLFFKGAGVAASMSDFKLSDLKLSGGE